MKLKTMHIGLDDTDSVRKGCTTYIAALLVEKLEKMGATFLDYPSLVRLNPNVPWKTRGNGALCLRINYPQNDETRIKETIISAVEKNSDLEDKGTDPGVVFLYSTKVPKDIQLFSRKTVTGISTLSNALDLIKKFKGEAVGFKRGRGIIGALAAIGETFHADHTYEIIAYRTPRNCGKKRRVDEASICRMDRETCSATFSNVDVEKKRVIITPRGPDPILFGIRGENPQILKEAFQIVKPLEPVERWVIFRTNQGTDAHLMRVDALDQIRPYNSVIVEATVSTDPKIIRGRHVIFSVFDHSSQVDCAAYEPTGALRSAAKKLLTGDRLVVSGGVRPASRGNPVTINVEKFRALKLAGQISYHNPVCQVCGSRLKSMGRNQGLRCEKCRTRYPSLKKVVVKTDRDLKRGLYITSTRSLRHLTKPYCRYGREKRRGQIEDLVNQWHYP
jgi:tRNA(Ile2)-agmatinylcytidine synthase